MARNIITFIAMISREGSAGSVRGKIPAGLVKQINAKEGNGIQFEVHGNTLVGAKVLAGKELRDAIKEKAASAPAKATATPKAKSTAKVVKTTPKASPEAPKAKVRKPAPAVAKPSKRKTEVEYEAPKKVKKVATATKPVFKLKRKK